MTIIAGVKTSVENFGAYRLMWPNTSAYATTTIRERKLRTLARATGGKILGSVVMVTDKKKLTII